MDFGNELRSERLRRGLTQADIATATGIARPNIAAYETGRREPRLSTATELLAAVNSTLTITPVITWIWTDGLRPYAVPARLWRLPIHQALATITVGQHLWWSGPDRTLDLADRQQRRRAYEIVLREGTPDDIQSTIDGLLLIEAWARLVIPGRLRQAWTPIIDAALNPTSAAAA